MRKLRIGLEIVATGALIVVWVLQIQAIDFDLPARQEREDLKLRNYVISHDLEYVKNELINLQKQQWKIHVAQSNDAKTNSLLLGLVMLVLSITLVRDFLKQGARGPDTDAKDRQ